MADLILVLDAGTTSTRAMVMGPDGRVSGMQQMALQQYYPQPGWVEHDAAEIWEKTLACARQVVAQAGGASRIAAIGIANQRETTIAWNRQSGLPLARAIVWQDRRTADFCAELQAAGHEDAVQSATGLRLDPYFSASKMRWLINHVPDVSCAAQQGVLALGTVESWLTFKLTGGALLSDASNASRTMLAGLGGGAGGGQNGGQNGGGWDAGLCDLFSVPQNALPAICDNIGDFGQTLPQWFGGAIRLCAMAGDQQAASIGQGCLARGDTKATFGTGAFILTNMGGDVPRSGHRLLGTVLHQLDGQRTYALEGSIFVAGSLIGWMRDRLGIIDDMAQLAPLAQAAGDTGGVVIIPALSGLGAPYWQPEARGMICGLSLATGRAQLVRAALEAMAHQAFDLAQAFADDGAPWASLRIDGGMAANDWIAQDLADILQLDVARPDQVETTALGAAMLAAVGCGLHDGLEQAAAAMRAGQRHFHPVMADEERSQRLERWGRAMAAL